MTSSTVHPFVKIEDNKDRERKRRRKFLSLSLSAPGGRMQAFARMSLPIRRVWNGVAAHIGVRKRGHMKLRKDVSSCEYEDVRVMWEMLSRNEADTIRHPGKRSFKKRTLSDCLEWAKRAPFLCRSF